VKHINQRARWAVGEKRYDWKYVPGAPFRVPVDITDNGKTMPTSVVCDLLNTQSAEIAGLRKACEWVLDATIGKKLNNYDRIPIPASALIALHEALGNPSEIPNSSEVPDAAEGG